MTREITRIPIAPRRVRLGPLLAHRWPLLALGSLLAVTGGLVAWMLFLAAGAKPSDQRRLDEEPTARVAATIVDVEAPLREADGTLVRWPDGVQRQRVRYCFRWREQEHTGESFAAVGAFRAQQEVTVELLPDEPNRNRVAGTLLHVEHGWLSAANWLLVVAAPGALALLSWLAGAFQLRRVLADGDVAAGTPQRVRPVPFVLPEMLAVRYAFRDHRAAERTGGHWVRLHSALGQRLLRQVRAERWEPLPVLHDRRFPQWSRMVLPQDFLPSSALREELS